MFLINENIDKIKALCEMHFVDTLYVFGSVLTNRFKKESDIDFLVRFSGVNLMDYFDNYMDFKEGLETLLSRKIDLLEIQALSNPILIKSIDREKIMIYGRTDSEVVV